MSNLLSNRSLFNVSEYSPRKIKKIKEIKSVIAAISSFEIQSQNRFSCPKALFNLNNAGILFLVMRTETNGMEELSI
jgi:hypothetical protein